MNDYKVTIKESTKELTARERLRMKDLTSSIKFDDFVTPTEQQTITPAFSCVLSVHNPSAEKVDYEVYIIEDKDGHKFYTSSESFWQSYKDIVEEMGDEEFSIIVYKVESKNRKGQYFITCSIA